jgi:hypothetical protein
MRTIFRPRVPQFNALLKRKLQRNALNVLVLYLRTADEQVTNLKLEINQQQMIEIFLQ